MPYQAVLDDLIATGEVTGALLLDAQGEVVVEAGARDERHRLIGAYQGLALAAMRRMVDGPRWGEIRYLVARHEHGHVIVRPLKDGYYLTLALPLDAKVVAGLHRSDEAQIRMNEAL